MSGIDEWENQQAQRAERTERCPDKGYCHGTTYMVGSEPCPAGGCLRVLTSGPLSGVFPHDEWPAEVAAKAHEVRGATEYETQPEVTTIADKISVPIDSIQGSVIRVPCGAPAPLVLNGAPYVGCSEDKGHFPGTQHKITVCWGETATSQAIPT